MADATQTIETKPTFLQRVGSFLEAMAYSEVDFTYETMDHIRKEQDIIRSRIDDLESRKF